ncbi:MAG: hypothetical protein A2157_07340 [Deltaproteobacteria bacterium RBG_16_47_11]|nr:MAG: hypothetical protein A2157_07340 [Deltaproteobacteria bacterium RBG_16_47_11]
MRFYSNDLELEIIFPKGDRVLFSDLHPVPSLFDWPVHIRRYLPSDSPQTYYILSRFICI